MPTERTSHSEQPLAGHQDRAPETLRVWLLGGFRVSVGSRTIEGNEWRLRKAAALVKLLALAPGHRLQREQVMDLLWPDLGKKAASNNLRQVLHAARNALDPAQGSRYLSSQDELLMLFPEGDLLVDIEVFEEAAATARRSADPAAYRSALDLYTGDLLPEDRYEAWAEERREQLRRTFVELLLELAGLYERSGDREAAIQASRRVLEADPHREEAHVSLMRLNAFSGRSAEALTQYGALEGTLLRVGAEPSASSRTLRDEIALGTFVGVPEEDRRGNQLQETAHAAGKHNLPAPRDNFVGREQEMVEIKRMLSMTRLLTLTGAGGSGKTRLSLEIARDLIGAYPDGVWLVELAPLSEGDLVAQEVAGALEISERPAEPLIDTLVDVIGFKNLLLILDNCEHLVEAAARLVDTLLSSCPHLRVLATSRETLGVGGEVLWRVPPLSLPDQTDGEPDGRSAIESLVRYEAVRLFVDRARLRLLDFKLTQENAGAVLRVCRKLDGIPLAIELATARMGSLAVEQVAQRLEVSLDLLKGASRTAEPRQQTLRATLDWSYDLLSEAEQTLFGRLSVFAGGWTLEAVEAVCSRGGIEQEDVLDLLSGLVDKSLVVAESSTEGTARYSMLEPVRQYAREKLNQREEAEAVRRHHAEYFLTLAEEANPELIGQDQIEWLERLESEHDNMRAVLSRPSDRNEVEVALRLGGALWWFWWVRGYHSEGRLWLEEALAMDGRVSPEVRAMALAGVGALAWAQGDLERGKEACEEGLQLLEHEAREGSEPKLCLLVCLGWVAWLREEYGQATQLFEESLALSREMSDTWWLATSLSNLALVSHSLGDSEKATELYEKSMDLFRKQGDKQSLASCLNNLAMVVYSQGDLGRAAQLTEEAVALLRELGARGGVALGLCNLGWMALLQDDLGKAADLYRESLSLSWDTGMNLLVQSALEGFACVTGAKGDAERSARLWGAARALHETKGIPRDTDFLAEADARISAVRLGMGEEVWEEAWRKGRAMTLDEAVSYALEEEEETDPLTTSAPWEPSAGHAPVTLTHREQEVAALVARGHTNRQIASHLMLSEHTVATHIRNILKKLELHSRTQIAAYFREQP